MRSASLRPLVLAVCSAVIAAAAVALAVSGARAAEVTRIAGPERIATAAAAALEVGPSDVVYVATALDFPDALAGGAAAARLGAPLVLVNDVGVPPPTAEALEAIDPDRIIVLGGPAAVAPAVVAELGAFATVDRIGGDDRFDTAVRISAELSPDGADVVVLASGTDFPDAVVGAVAAVADDAPVLLTAPDLLVDVVADELGRLEPDRIVVLGGTAAITDDVVAAASAAAGGADTERRSGPERTATAAAVSEAAFPDGADTAVIATGQAFADALAGGPLAAALDAPVLLSATACLSAPAADELDRLGVDRVVLLGGEAALSPEVAELAVCGGDPGDDDDDGDDDGDDDEPEDVTVITTEVATGLAAPWGMAFLPDGDALVTERDSGDILRIDPSTGSSEVLATIADVDSSGSEAGLLGVAIGPDDGLVYVYYTSGSDNRIVRMDLDGGQPEVVLDGIPRAGTHNGGRIAFGPDGLLYVGTGDAQDLSAPRDPDSLAGKVLRIDPDGGIPADNPFDNAVWSIGHRNVQGLTWDGDDRLYATEFGPGVDDEVNLIVAGADYGWPDETGPSDDPDITDPIVVRQPADASWSGAAVLVDGAVPQWEGDLFVAALRGERLWRFSLDDGAVTDDEELLVGERGRLRDVVVAPDGALWVLTSNTDGRGDAIDGDDRILRLGPQE